MVLIKELTKSTVVFRGAFDSRTVGRISATRNRMRVATTAARNTRMLMQAQEVGMMQRRA